MKYFFHQVLKLMLKKVFKDLGRILILPEMLLEESY